MKKNTSNLLKRGFTMLEIILVIAVIGLLAAMLAPSFTGVGAAASTATATNDAAVINRLLDGIDAARESAGDPPATYADLTAIGTALNGAGTTVASMTFKMPVGKSVPTSGLTVSGNRVN